MEDFPEEVTLELKTDAKSECVRGKVEGTPRRAECMHGSHTEESGALEEMKDAPSLGGEQGLAKAEAGRPLSHCPMQKGPEVGQAGEKKPV